MTIKTMNGKTTMTSFKTSIEIPLEHREKMIALLNAHLACTFDLMSQTKQAHWNVKGSHFIALHQMFDDFAVGLTAYMDMIAERVTALGGYAIGTVRMAAAASQLDEYPTSAVRGVDHVRALAQRYAAVAKMLREGIVSAAEVHDHDTADLLTQVSRDLDKWLWFLEAHVQA